MPKRATSGVKGLSKTHARGCINRGRLTDCDCAWRGRYKYRNVVLAHWAHQKIDPQDRAAAERVLARLIVAIDSRTFDPTGERPVQGSGQRLSDFILEWTTHYREKRGHTGTGARSMLGVLARSRLGAMSLEQLAGASLEIERWLDETAKIRRWKPVHWNHYRALLSTLFATACKWRVHDVPRMSRNPMEAIEPMRVFERLHLREVRLDGAIEDRLLAACDVLDQPPQHPTRPSLTFEQVREIRARVKAGERQAVVAEALGLSSSTVSKIVTRTTWTTKTATRTKGREMRRRLYLAFDTGARAGEMLAIQVRHVQWQRPQSITLDDGTTFHGYEILLPAELTKGGKTTGQRETLFAGTLRLVEELEARRFQLQNNPDAYLFGTEDGRPVKRFERLWRHLFKLAGLRYGRDNGLVWHTTRHEFISRTAENTGDPVLAQHLARHRALTTTRSYFHTDSSRKWAAVAQLNRYGFAAGSTELGKKTR